MYDYDYDFWGWWGMGELLSFGHFSVLKKAARSNFAKCSHFLTDSPPSETEKISQKDPNSVQTEVDHEKFDGKQLDKAKEKIQCILRNEIKVKALQELKRWRKRSSPVREVAAALEPLANDRLAQEHC